MHRTTLLVVLLSCPHSACCPPSITLASGRRVAPGRVLSGQPQATGGEDSVSPPGFCKGLMSCVLVGRWEPLALWVLGTQGKVWPEWAAPPRAMATGRRKEQRVPGTTVARKAPLMEARLVATTVTGWAGYPSSQPWPPSQQGPSRSGHRSCQPSPRPSESLGNGGCGQQGIPSPTTARGLLHSPGCVREGSGRAAAVPGPCLEPHGGSAWPSTFRRPHSLAQCFLAPVDGQ